MTAPRLPAVVIGHGPRPGDSYPDGPTLRRRARVAAHILAPVAARLHPTDGAYNGGTEPGTYAALRRGADVADLLMLALRVGVLTRQESVLYLYTHGNRVRSRLLYCPEDADPDPRADDWYVYPGRSPEGDWTTVYTPRGPVTFHARPE